MKRCTSFLVSLLLFTLFGTSAGAATVSLALKDVLSVENIRLQGISDNTDAYDFKLSIPQRWTADRATLTFSYANSSALIKDRSRLIFSFDGEPLSQIALDPLSTKGTVSVSIPGRLLAPGYHSFRFEVSQHSVPQGCEDPSAPELWTWVELNNATLDYEFRLNPVPLQISAVTDFLFDAKNPNPPPVNLVFPAMETPVLKPVGLCASGVALRYGYRRVSFVSREGLKPGMDTLVIGPQAFVKTVLAGTGVIKDNWQVNGPSLSLHDLPLEKQIVSGTPEWTRDPDHGLILVTGRTWEEVETAAKTLSILSLPLPDARSITVNSVLVPEINPYTFKGGLEPAKTYTLSSLGFKTTTFKGIFPVPRGFDFRIPSDTHLSPNNQAILALDMAYGSTMRKDSVLNIQLNNKFIAAIPCSDPQGGIYRNYQVRIPLSSMNPGFNKLTFSPQLTPMVTDQCTMIQTGNLRMTISENSTFTLPDLDHWIEMPHLGAFMTDAFPFGRKPDMAETLIVIPDKTRSSFVAAVNLVALASQKTGFAPLEADWQFAMPDKTARDIILVSGPSAIPETLRDRAPLNLTTPGPLAYPHLPRPKGDPEPQGLWSKLIPSPRSKVVDISLVDAQLVITHLDPVLMENRLALIQFQSPFDRTRTVLVMTAQSPEEMDRGGLAIWDTGFQATCKGDIALVNLSGKEIQSLSLKLGPSYYLGKLTSLPFVEYYANTYSKWFILGIIGVCVLLTLLIYAGLKRRFSRRTGDA